MATTEEALDKARKSLERIQQFDTASLPREAQLGQDLNFKDAVEPAQRIVDLFRQIPLEALSGLPNNHLAQVTNQADSFFNTLGQVEKFNPKEANAYGTRNGLIDNIRGVYEQHFNALHPIVSYCVSRQRDFSAIERDFRASIQRSEDAAAELTRKLEAQQQDGQKILEEVRRVAAEQGVSQQATYFHSESVNHDKEANFWRGWTVAIALALGIYAIASLFLHKWTFLTPGTVYETVQLGLSKFLVFAVLAYMLLLCARNFLSHKHNSIVNKHRQNALLTFNALVEAAGSEERRDVILTYAAACIFAPQDTGYSKPGSGPQMELPTSVIQALPKLATSSSPH